MTPACPFDRGKLAALAMERGIDVVLATSPHNVQYLLGGYRFFLYAKLDAIGPSRYLPCVAVPAAEPEAAFYVGAGNEAWGTDVAGIWVNDIANVSWGTVSAAEEVARRLSAAGYGRATVGIEPAFVPADAYDALRRALPAATFVEAVTVMEELRAVKREDELALIRAGSAAVVDAMLATFHAAHTGATTAQITERLRAEQTLRGLDFAYCLVAAGASHNRAPSGRTLEDGDVLSLDSGASYHGYTADLTRMAVAGRPSEDADRLLAHVAAVQAAARAQVRPGVRGGDIFDAADEALGTVPHRDRYSFLAHGTGLLTHEAPRLTDSGSPPYPAAHRERALEPGMVLSIETHVADPASGFIKLEDTLIVTSTGHEAAGDHGRDWNRVGG
jgi:Xaa-Pro aminopeptidase